MADHEFGQHAVYVTYRFTAMLSDDAIAEAVADLSPEERYRHDRFHFERDRRDFAVAHALLRRCLSECGDRPPNGWTFTTGKNGKPLLAHEDALRTHLTFNLSHTTGLVACAVGHNVELGVDVERVAGRSDMMALSERFFASIEASALRGLDEFERPARFIETWTLKEAFTKAIGEGLSCPLDTFSFILGDEGSLCFECARLTRARLWSFHLFAPSSDHRLAVAIGANASEPAALRVEPMLSPVRTVVVALDPR